MPSRAPTQETSSSIAEQDLERDEIRMLIQAKEKLEEARAALLHIKLPTEGKATALAANRGQIRNNFANHFAGALMKLENDDGAIAKIRAAQSYAHEVVNSAQRTLVSAQKQNDMRVISIQTKVLKAQKYLQALDRRIESIERELLVYLRGKQNMCLEDSEFKRVFEYTNAADNAVKKTINPLISMIDRDIETARGLFNIEVESERQSVGKIGWRRILPF